MGADWDESGKNSSVGLVFDFFMAGDAMPMNCSASVKMPKRIQKRLSESKAGTCTAEEIDAKLREADLRRKVLSLFLFFPSLYSNFQVCFSVLFEFKKTAINRFFFSLSKISN